PEFVRAAQRDSVSFFFTNLPDAADVAGLWKKFVSFGNVSDVFIPAKRNKLGNRFGFVRFKFVQDVAALLSKLQKFWLGESKLLINVSRFGRDSFSGSRAPKVNRAGIGFDATVSPLSKSFAEAATGNLRTSTATDPPPELTLPPPSV
ncbi:RNA-binding protein 25-like, partial [Trifolium medium]|nr:RNA-binding protein 25-like [Trifolium medium]